MDPIRRPPWDGAGGPRECVHGYAEDIPCPACDELPREMGLRRRPPPVDLRPCAARVSARLQDEPCFCCGNTPTPRNTSTAELAVQGRLCERCFWVLYKRMRRGSIVGHRKGPHCKIRIYHCTDCTTLRVDRRASQSSRCSVCAARHRAAVSNAWSARDARTARGKAKAARSNRAYAERQRQGVPLFTRHPLAKLTYDQAEAIRARVAAGEFKSALAREFGVGYGTIYQIILGMTYKQQP